MRGPQGRTRKGWGLPREYRAAYSPSPTTLCAFTYAALYSWRRSLFWKRYVQWHRQTLERRNGSFSLLIWNAQAFRGNGQAVPLHKDYAKVVGEGNLLPVSQISHSP